MEVKFLNEELEKFYLMPMNEIKGKRKYPDEVIKQFKKKIQILTAITRLEQLRQHKGLNFEYLKGERAGECSIRLNIQYRLLFIPASENSIRVILIKEISKHYE